MVFGTVSIGIFDILKVRDWYFTREYTNEGFMTYQSKKATHPLLHTQPQIPTHTPTQTHKYATYRHLSI